ncbi:hypothetical protein NL676_023505 [Syzygium grande]|nr:hypothetical protein NL676_023505 [Syzygium grande]
MCSSFESRASLSESESSVVGESASSSLLSSSAVLSDEVVDEAFGAGDADEALRIIVEKAGREGRRDRRVGLLSIMSAALERNAGLALSVFYAMRATFEQGVSCHSIYMVFPGSDF